MAELNVSASVYFKFGSGFPGPSQVGGEVMRYAFLTISVTDQYGLPCTGLALANFVVHVLDWHTGIGEERYADAVNVDIVPITLGAGHPFEVAEGQPGVRGSGALPAGLYHLWVAKTDAKNFEYDRPWTFIIQVIQGPSTPSTDVRRPGVSRGGRGLFGFGGGGTPATIAQGQTVVGVDPQITTHA
jgi:hypothetical protein